MYFQLVGGARPGYNVRQSGPGGTVSAPLVQAFPAAAAATAIVATTSNTGTSRMTTAQESSTSSQKEEQSTCRTSGTLSPIPEAGSPHHIAARPCMPLLREETVEIDSGVMIEQDSCMSVAQDGGDRRGSRPRKDSIEVICEKPVALVIRRKSRQTPPTSPETIKQLVQVEYHAAPDNIIVPVHAPTRKDVKVIAESHLKHSFSLKHYRPAEAMRQLIRRIQGDSSNQSLEMTYKSVSCECIPMWPIKDESDTRLARSARSLVSIDQLKEGEISLPPPDLVSRAREWL